MSSSTSLTRVAGLALAGLLIVFAPAACGSAQTPQDPDVTLTTDPNPPQAGRNRFIATVQEDGQPVTDAEVAVELHMAAMPEMNMPEMRNRVTLGHQAAGRYDGAGDLPMAGRWDATVVVSRQGEEIGRVTVPITAQ